MPMRLSSGISRLFSRLATLLCLFQVVSLVSQHTILRTNPRLGFDVRATRFLGNSTSALAVSPSFFDCCSELFCKGRAVQLLRRIALASYLFPDFLDALEVSGSRQLEGALYFCRAVTHLACQNRDGGNEARRSHLRDARRASRQRKGLGAIRGLNINLDECPGVPTRLPGQPGAVSLMQMTDQGSLC